jgi:hypothetical protein
MADGPHKPANDSTKLNSPTTPSTSHALEEVQGPGKSNAPASQTPAGQPDALQTGAKPAETRLDKLPSTETHPDTGHLQDSGNLRLPQTQQERVKMPGDILRDTARTGLVQDRQITTADGKTLTGSETWNPKTREGSFIARNAEGGYTPFKMSPDRQALETTGPNGEAVRHDIKTNLPNPETNFTTAPRPERTNPFVQEPVRREHQERAPEANPQTRLQNPVTQPGQFRENGEGRKLEPGKGTGNDAGTPAVRPALWHQHNDDKGPNSGQPGDSRPGVVKPATVPKLDGGSTPENITGRLHGRPFQPGGNDGQPENTGLRPGKQIQPPVLDGQPPITGGRPHGRGFQPGGQDGTPEAPIVKPVRPVQQPVVDLPSETPGGRQFGRFKGQVPGSDQTETPIVQGQRPGQGVRPVQPIQAPIQEPIQRFIGKNPPGVLPASPEPQIFRPAQMPIQGFQPGRDNPDWVARHQPRVDQPRVGPDFNGPPERGLPRRDMPVQQQIDRFNDQAARFQNIQNARLNMVPELRNMDPRQRAELIDRAAQTGPRGEGPHVLEGKISMVLPGRVLDGKGQGPGLDAAAAAIQRDALGRLAGGKPGDLHFEGRLPGGGLRSDMAVEGRAGRMAEGLPHQIDGKLLAQLQSLGRQSELRGAFLDAINRFQDGKLTPTGKDGAVFNILQGMNPRDVNGLQAWLTDSRRNQFDFRQLDGKAQQDISRIVDSLLGRGMDRTTSSAMLDARGLHSTMLDGATASLRSLSGDRAASDFRINIKDLDPGLQTLLSRLQAREGFAAAAERAPLTRPEMRLDAREEGIKDGVRLSETGRDAITRLGEINRGLTHQGEDGRAAFEAWKGRPDVKQDGPASVTDIKARPVDPRETAVRAQNEEKEHENPADRVKALQTDQAGRDLQEAKNKKEDEKEAKEKEDKEKEEREEKERLRLEKEKEERERLEKERQEKDRLEKERLEKEKQDEKKRQQDEETPYVVQPNETLLSIAERVFHTADYAQIIYDRNLSGIMLHQHKNQTYAKLYPRQRIILPNQNYIDKFKKSMKSHKQINFGRPEFASADEELAAMFGLNWAGSAAGSRSIFAGSKDEGPVTRRSFSGNSAAATDAERKSNVREAFGLSTPEEKQSAKYSVHLGESLRSIAQKLYKSPAYWRLLAIKNNLSCETDSKGNPQAQLRRGQQLILPDSGEIESFARNQLTPVVVALHTDRRGLELPRVRHCGYCKRSTLAMAVSCIGCGVDMDKYVPVRIGADGEEEDPQQSTAILSAIRHAVDQVGALQLQDMTLTNQPQEAFEGSGQPEEVDRQAHDPHPLPHADLTDVDLGFEQEQDPLWTTNKEPVLLAQHVRVVESEMMEDNKRCLLVTLQIFTGGQWLTVYDYQIGAENLVIHKYRRAGGRRMLRKNMPAAQSKQFAWNHFRNSWQSLCNEFWSS